ncbi:MAG: hypothetical protein RDV48_19135 [Candidatus Eremiobacteraeota bacterium]|nr:hypothetical protein [Candidatus Eremiobacteraeota bacterium]
MTDEEKEKIFVELVKYSWDRYNEIFSNQKLDEIFLGSVITSNVKRGYSLIDLNSDGVNHFLRFENLTDKTRLIFRLNNLSEDLTVAKVQGHMADVVIGYGEKVSDIGAVWNTFKAEIKSTFIINKEPGVITCDADLTGGYIYAQIPLIFNLDLYIKHTYHVNIDLLNSHIDATVHSLKKYLDGRLAIKV